MKASLFLIFSACLSLTAMAEELTTTDGRAYTGVTVTKVEPDGIRIIHESGTAKIPFAKLPPALQKQHGYDPAKAAEFKQKADAALAAQEAALDQELGEQAAQAEQEKTTAAQNKDLAQKARFKRFRVAQVTADGLLANTVTIEETIIASRGASVGMGGNVASGRSITYVGNSFFFIAGYPSAASLAEGKDISGKFFENGNYTYTDTDGASRTVTQYQFVSPK